MCAFKIWIIASFLFTAYGGLSDSDDDICIEDKSDLCHSEETRNSEFPETIAAVDKMCPALTTRLACLLDYENKCGIDHPDNMDERLALTTRLACLLGYENKCGTEHPHSMEDRPGKIYELTLEACDKNTELHQDLADNLACIKSLTSNHRDVCQPIVDDAVDAVRKRIFFETDKEDSRKLFCINEAFDFACFVARAGVDCGSDAKEFVGRIVDRVGFLDVACQADFREEVKEMLAITQLEMEEKLALEKNLSKE